MDIIKLLLIDAICINNTKGQYLFFRMKTSEGMHSQSEIKT